MIDEGLERAIFNSTYPGLDPGKLTWSIYVKMCNSVSVIRTYASIEYESSNQNRASLDRTNRRQIIEGYYPVLFRKIGASDG